MLFGGPDVGASEKTDSSEPQVNFKLKSDEVVLLECLGGEKAGRCARVHQFLKTLPPLHFRPSVRNTFLGKKALLDKNIIYKMAQICATEGAVAILPKITKLSPK